MKKRIHIRHAIFSLLLVFVLSGCGGSPAPSTSLVQPTTTAAPPTTSQVQPQKTSQATASPTQPIISSAAATSTAPKTSASVPVSTPPASATSSKTQEALGGVPVKVPHTLDGAYGPCFTCHLETGKPALALNTVTIQHACDQCHCLTPLLEAPSHTEELASDLNTLVLTCKTCHKVA